MNLLRNLKIIFFFIIFFIFISIFFPEKSYSQQFGFPGADCGNAYSEKIEERKCCQPIQITLPKNDSLISKVPILSSILDWLENLFNPLKRAENIIPCSLGFPSTRAGDPNCVCLKEEEIILTPTLPINAMKDLCEKYVISEQKEACRNCALKGGVWTALTCVYGDLNYFIKEILLGWGIGLSGLITLMCIIFSAFQLQTSQGSAEKIKKAQEMLTSCIMGLMLIIFSVFILRLIGVNILKIPGFQ